MQLVVIKYDGAGKNDVLVPAIVSIGNMPGKHCECLLECLCSQVCVGNNTNYSAAQGQAADQVWKLSRVHHSKWSLHWEHCTVLHCTALYCSVHHSKWSPDLGTLYCTVLYCTVHDNKPDLGIY